MIDNKDVLEYWNKDEVESMYDKHLINAEIALIKRNIPANAKILDAGCGEGEGTIVYSDIDGVTVHAADFSETRLKKAAELLAGRKNVEFKEVDFLKEYDLDDDYDVIVSQRFLINIMEWDAQKQILSNLMDMLKPGGMLLMLEGSKQGVDSLNDFRALFELEPIPVKWHNLFFDDDRLKEFMTKNGYTLESEDGLGAYFMLTRGVRPTLDDNLDWDCDFNQLSAAEEVAKTLNLGPKLSRLKLWIFKK